MPISWKHRCFAGWWRMGDSYPRYELDPGDTRYPSCVKDLACAPMLYVIGNLAALNGRAAAVIGSRRATPYGMVVADMIATAAAESGITVVSGGAKGCDFAAGTAAIGAGGTHVIVAGTGADVIYPRTSAELFDRTLACGGAIVSLERWGAGPRRFAFPKRNRIIAALSQAVFIAEAGLPSGTFSTAEAALELGREVLAAPGAITSSFSRGANHLIANGAGCLIDEESVEVAISRIFGTLRYQRLAPKGNPANDECSQVLDALFASPLRLEEIAAMLSMSPMDCLSHLSRMMMQGDIERMPDGTFTPTVRAFRARSAILSSGKHGEAEV